LDRRQGILIELLRHEALPSTPSCSLCHKSSATHRCQDCFGPNLWCGPCCIVVHKALPFHRIKMWNGHYFEHSDLLTHGLTLDLCHYPDHCPSVQHTTETDLQDLDLSDGSDEFAYGHQQSVDSESTTNAGSRSKLTIVSSTGIFTRSIRWCHCATSSRQYTQLLLRAKLFPASFKNPKTAFTFEVLDHFRVDALECKTAAMNFMSKIQRITNEAFPSQVPVSLPIRRNIFRQLINLSRIAIENF
jgi:CxC2 like cysteine cluster associated with KDZ transposases